MRQRQLGDVSLTVAQTRRYDSRLRSPGSAFRAPPLDPVPSPTVGPYRLRYVP
jgi:hypothetical protein